MTKPTLVQAFGPGATQNATDLILKKADLPGLTASASNDAESLVAAIMQRWLLDMTQTNWNGSTARKVFVDGDNAPQIALQGSANVLVYQVVISVSQPLPGAASFVQIDPDNV